MEVKKNAPPPVVQPPTTYDIIGLSREEAHFLRDLLGATSYGSPAGELYSKLYDAIGSPYSTRWRFFTRADRGDPTRREIRTIHPEPRL